MLKKGHVLNSRYQIQAVLGEGGFGAVYKAWLSLSIKACLPIVRGLAQLGVWLYAYIQEQTIPTLSKQPELIVGICHSVGRPANSDFERMGIDK